jgi:hypothetical protein
VFHQFVDNLLRLDAETVAQADEDAHRPARDFFVIWHRRSIAQGHTVPGIGARRPTIRQYGTLPDIDPDNQVLTVDQAYLAAYEFIRQFYERDSRKPVSMFHLLSWMQMEQPRESSDPAQWYDWLTSVGTAISQGSDEQFSIPLSQPSSR